MKTYNIDFKHSVELWVANDLGKLSSCYFKTESSMDKYPFVYQRLSFPVNFSSLGELKTIR